MCIEPYFLSCILCNCILFLIIGRKVSPWPNKYHQSINQSYSLVFDKQKIYLTTSKSQFLLSHHIRCIIYNVHPYGKNYWADNSYYSDLEITIYGQ